MFIDQNNPNPDLNRWAELAKIGSTTAMSGLSQIINQDIQITALEIEEVSTLHATEKLSQKEDMLTGVYLLFSGDCIYGQMLLAFQPQIAFQLVDMALDQPAGTTHSLDDMGKSTLAEMGNIVGGFFLNGLSEQTGLRLMPSTPTVLEDNAEQIIRSIRVKAVDSCESTFVIKLVFSADDQRIEGNFMVIPTREFINLTRKHIVTV